MTWGGFSQGVCCEHLAILDEDVFEGPDLGDWGCGRSSGERSR